MMAKKGVVRRPQAGSEGVRRALAAKVSRRTALRGVGIGIGLLAGCSDDGDGDALTARTGGGATDSNAGGTAGDTSGSAGTGSATAWATGGTAAMLAAASYPDPFETAESGCALTCILTQARAGPPRQPSGRTSAKASPASAALMLRVLDADGCTP